MFISRQAVLAKLSQVFEIDALRAGGTFGRDENTQVLHFWYGITSYFDRSNPSSKDSVLVAVVTTNQWKKGVLWVPFVPPDADAAQQATEKVIIMDLAVWNDPVLRVLHDLDVAPQYHGWSIYGGMDCGHELYVETPASAAYIMYEVRGRNPSLDRLFPALLDTICTIAELFGDSTLQEYLDPIPGQTYSRYFYKKYGIDPSRKYMISPDDSDDYASITTW